MLDAAAAAILRAIRYDDDGYVEDDERRQEIARLLRGDEATAYLSVAAPPCHCCRFTYRCR